MEGRRLEDVEIDQDEEEETELEFRDGSYLLNVFVSPGTTLSVEVERKTDGRRWRGDFTARFIEEITQRAGNVKSFTNFVKMLRSATVPPGSMSLRLDVLTHQDLEVLKDGNVANKENSFSKVVDITDKRYLILTYTTEFDRVHYPLPLLHDEISETVGMRKCIQKLRYQLASMKNRLRRYEARCTLEERVKWVASSDDDNNGSPHVEGYQYGVKDASSNSGFHRAQLLETRALQERVNGMEDKLRMERIAVKKSIATLLKRNARLQEEARLAKEGERRSLEKLRNSAIEIRLLRGKLKSVGLNAVSPGLRMPASPPVGRAVEQKRLPPSPSPSTSRSGCRSRISGSPQSNPSAEARRLRPSWSPPTTRCDDRARSPGSSPQSLHAHYRQMLSSVPPSSRCGNRQKTSASPSTSRYEQPRPLPHFISPRTSRGVQQAGSLFPSRSHMSSPRSSPTASRPQRGSRSQSCPTTTMRRDRETEWYVERPRRRQCPPKVAVASPQRRSQRESEQESTGSRRDSTGTAETECADYEIGEIDFRLYTLQNYLKNLTANDGRLAQQI